jgi:hypothetical protein
MQCAAGRTQSAGKGRSHRQQDRRQRPTDLARTRGHGQTGVRRARPPTAPIAGASAQAGQDTET